MNETEEFSSVDDLLTAEDLGAGVQKEYDQLNEETVFVRALERARSKEGLTQAQVAKKLGVTQSAVSKLETGKDADLTIGQLAVYSQILNDTLTLRIGPPMSHVDEVKKAAGALRHHLEVLAALANEHEDSEIESGIREFFGEAFYNLMNILTDCQEKLPQPKDSKKASTGGKRISIGAKMPSLVSPQKKRAPSRKQQEAVLG